MWRCLVGLSLRSLKGRNVEGWNVSENQFVTSLFGGTIQSASYYRFKVLLYKQFRMEVPRELSWVCKFSEILKGNSFIVPLSSEDHFGGVLEKTFWKHSFPSRLFTITFAHFLFLFASYCVIRLSYCWEAALDTQNKAGYQSPLYINYVLDFIQACPRCNLEIKGKKKNSYLKKRVSVNLQNWATHLTIPRKWPKKRLLGQIRDYKQH